MARQRIIKPDFYTDEALARCSAYARLLFPGLWMLADKRGRLKDQPEVIRGAIFPYEPETDVDRLLVELDAGGLVQRYEVEGRHFVWIPAFEKHQRPHPKEVESVIPAAPKFRGKRQPLAGVMANEPVGLMPGFPVGTGPSVPSVPSKPSENGRDGNEGPAATGGQADDPARPSRSVASGVTDSTAGEIEGIARELCETTGIPVPEWIARASRIEADARSPGKSFTDPRRKGLSEAWASTTLRKLREIAAEQKRPVPL